MAGKPSTIAKNKYNAKAYDRIAVQVPKGKRDELHRIALSKGYDSLNAYTRALYEADIGEALTPKPSDGGWPNRGEEG